MVDKPKIAFYWCSSCGGCEESLVDLAEDLLAVASRAEIVFWPVAFDTKYSDVEAMEDGAIAAVLINGAVRMDEQVAMAKLLRKKSRLVVAHGSCAHLGGVVGLANFSSRDEALRRAYLEAPSVVNLDGDIPETRPCAEGETLVLSGFHDRVKALDQVIEVDYYVPGCPPTPALLKEAITSILDGNLPPRGSVLADRKALCHTCPRRDSRPETVKIGTFKRLYEVEWDPAVCFLAQGIVCLGPVTRGGCAARCIGGNMPCRGCFGPTENVSDQGAKAASFLSSLIEAVDDEGVKKAVASIPDPGGLFYRYSLASSILKGRVGR